VVARTGDDEERLRQQLQQDDENEDDDNDVDHHSIGSRRDGQYLCQVIIVIITRCRPNLT